jgi:hypothetical protein
LWQADPENYQARDRLVYALNLLALNLESKANRQEAHALYREAASHGNVMLTGPTPQRVRFSLARIYLGLSRTVAGSDASCKFLAQAIQDFHSSGQKPTEDHPWPASEVKKAAAACRLGGAP